MARPAEKARAMMNKWVTMREAGNAPASTHGRRPNIAADCELLGDAEYYRDQILREVTKLIDQIQNPTLGEHTIRDVNDEINRKFREKHHWNTRILALSHGKIDYTKQERASHIEEGDVQFIAATNNGKRYGPTYRYYGAAKDLPGVKELLDKQHDKMKNMSLKKRGPQEIYRHITQSYFGWRDEEDGVLLELEEDAFQHYTTTTTTTKETAKRQKTTGMEDETESNNNINNNNNVVQVVNLDTLLSKDYLAGVPTQEEMQVVMFEEQKKALLVKLSM